jgi:hypothetical protein
VGRILNRDLPFSIDNGLAEVDGAPGLFDRDPCGLRDFINREGFVRGRAGRLCVFKERHGFLPRRIGSDTGEV